MKPVARLVLFALLPFLSGCISSAVIQKANNHMVQTALYGSVDRIEKAAVTKDNQLCIFFEKDLTNSSEKSRFTLILPLAQIQANAHWQAGYATAADFKVIITSATLHISGGLIRTNYTLLEDSKNDLKYIPVGKPLILGGSDSAQYHGLNLTLLSNATQTVYLTRTNPIEFTYVDASIKRSLTIITVDPLIVSSTRIDHPGYYCLLPLTVPADIALSPLYGIALLLFIASGGIRC